MLWVVDSGNQEAFMEVTRRQRERQKGRGTKMTGGIQMHLSNRVNPLVCLFSFQLGHWTQKKGRPMLNLCVCASVWGLRERVLADVCILAGWTVLAFESMSVYACMLACLHKRWRKLVHTHASILLPCCCLTSSSSVKDGQPLLRVFLLIPCLKLNSKSFEFTRDYPCCAALSLLFLLIGSCLTIFPPGGIHIAFHFPFLNHFHHCITDSARFSWLGMLSSLLIC